MSDFGENRFPRRSALAQRIAIMGYLFSLAKQIDPRIRYTMDVSTLIGLIYIAKCSLSLFGSIFSGKLIFKPFFAMIFSGHFFVLKFKKSNLF